MFLWFAYLAILPFQGPASYNRCGSRYEATVARLSAIDQALTTRQLVVANKKLDKALAKLGDVTVNNSTADDTGLSIIFANSQARAGQLDVATLFKREILHTRLKRCTRPL